MSLYRSWEAGGTGQRGEQGPAGGQAHWPAFARFTPGWNAGGVGGGAWD